MCALTSGCTQLIQLLLRIYGKALSDNFNEDADHEDITHYPVELGTAGCPIDGHAYASWESEDAAKPERFSHVAVCSLEYSLNFDNIFHTAGPALRAASKAFVKGQTYAVCFTPFPDSLDMALDEASEDAGGPTISAPRKGGVEQIAVMGMTSIVKMMVRPWEIAPMQVALM